MRARRAIHLHVVQTQGEPGFRWMVTRTWWAPTTRGRSDTLAEGRSSVSVSSDVPLQWQAEMLIGLAAAEYRSYLEDDREDRP